MAGERREMCLVGVCVATAGILGFVALGGSVVLTTELNHGTLLRKTPTRLGSLRRRDGSWAIVSGSERVAASGWYAPWTTQKSGFAVLHVEARKSRRYTDRERAYGAGLVEGYLTGEEIMQAAWNSRCEVSCDGSVPPRIREYLEQQQHWITERIDANPDDATWRYVGLVYEQYKGLVAGVEMKTGQNATWAAASLNWLGDLFDVKPHTERVEEASRKLRHQGRCTALVKLVGDDVLFGHSAWFHYSNMNRAFKHYKLEFELGSPTTSFSSYFGMLSSLDDFYMVEETRLAVLQTTNNIYDATLWDDVRVQALPAWLRVRTANALATTGQEWADVLERDNSGTYNNQYIVIDLKHWPSLWIVEQIPGLVISANKTDHLLEHEYWPSFNVPYFEVVYNKSGYAELDTLHGRPRRAHYNEAPRARLLDRDHVTVTSIDAMKRIMRQNTYGTGDPLAPDPWSAVCARGDLVVPNNNSSNSSSDDDAASLAGCYDTKVSAASLFMRAWVVNGPTRQGQPPFDWSRIRPLGDDNDTVWDTSAATYDTSDGATLPITGSTSHRGQPTVFDFDFELLAPAWTTTTLPHLRISR